MKHLKSIFHFLGSIQLAIFLIATTAFVTIIGTLIESITGSHLLAARWTYENIAFTFLLCLFFVNILVSALRRWPFKKKHIPFLITHLGLLMIISGTMIKNYWGLQGNLSIWEGSGHSHVLIPNTHSLLVEEKFSSTPYHSLKLDSSLSQLQTSSPSSDLKFKVIGYAPHVKSYLETWIKGSKAYIAGLPLQTVQEWNLPDPFPTSSSYMLSSIHPFSDWTVLALRTPHVQEAVEQSFLKDLILQIKSGDSFLNLFSISLKEVLQHPFKINDNVFSAKIQLDFSSNENTPSVYLEIHRQSSLNDQETLMIPLQGQKALYSERISDQWRKPSFTVDLIRPRFSLLIIEDEQQQTKLFAFDLSGRFYYKDFDTNQFTTMIAYDHGFDGYGIEAIIPFPSFSASREDQEKAQEFNLMKQLQKADRENISLTPPLKAFKKACELAQKDWTIAFINFLKDWHIGTSPLFDFDPSPSLVNIFHHFDWQNISENDQQTILWTCQMIHQLDEQIKQGTNPLQFLENSQWPLISQLKQAIQANPKTSPWILLAQQMASLTSYLPKLKIPSSFSEKDKAQFLSAYCLIYGIDYPSLISFQPNETQQFDNLKNYWKAHSENQEIGQTHFTFETSLTQRIVPTNIPSRLEDCCPGIVVEIQEGQQKQMIALAYDSAATGLKWPVLNRYLIRFQPYMQQIPYHIRLKQARQLTYPLSSQVYSYESDVWITDRQRSSILQTLSMNHVHETWDGYRFYLAGIAYSPDNSLKRIQLAVNYDPAKYILTYPGGFLIFLGSMMLFWLVPYLKKQKN